MKYILALIMSLFFTVTAYASPEIYSNGLYKDKIVSIGTIVNKYNKPRFYIYSTQESLEANNNKTNYHNYNIWILDILLAPAQEELRMKMINNITSSKNIKWITTKSGSKKFWAAYNEIVYNPTYNRLSIKLPESYLNDQGEVMGMSGHSRKYEEHDLSKLSSHDFLIVMIDIVNDYLKKHYPRIDPNQGKIE